MKIYNYIYLITNNINGKIYIGKHSTDNIDDDYMGSGILIKKAILKYGIENFTKEYLAFCDTEEKLNWLEKFYIKKYKAREVGYNLTDGGDGSLGRKQTEESKEKNHQAHLGKKVPKLSKALKGHISYWKNKSLSEEHKQKLSDTHKGKQHLEETKKKISEGHKGIKFSEEHKQKLSESQKGRPKPKYKWLTPTGEIIEMTKNNAHHYHKDWKLLEQV